MRFHSVALAALPLVLAADPASSQIYNQSRRPLRAPDVTVWLDRFTYAPGERIRPYFQSDKGAYVTIVRVTTAGDLTVLYPGRPSLQREYREGMLRDDEVPFSSYTSSFVNEPEGVGFVFAIASYAPFDYRQVARNDRWNTWQFAREIAQMRYGLRAYPDPIELIGRFIDQTVPRGTDYSTDYIQYQVIRHNYDRPRYANYRDTYYSCLRTYGGYAQYYCSDYATYGYGFFVPIIIARNPGTPTVPGTPENNRPRLKEKMVPDPVVPLSEGIGGGTTTPQPTPTSSNVERADAQRAWWTAQRARGGGGGDVSVDRAPRGEPSQTPLPEIYRGSVPAPRVDPAPRGEPVTQSRYEPIPQPRYEPPRVEQQQTRSEPVNQGRYEPPPQAAPQVMRIEPMQIPLSPPPAPPPPPPPPPPPQRSEPMQVAPPIHPSSPPSPAPAVEKGGSGGSTKEQ
jgi:hypothetical protein